MVKNTATRPTVKPSKPYPGFPLFPHSTRRWMKKIEDTPVYLGPWDDPVGSRGRSVHGARL